nr:MAG TPA: hypothetical protein [Caudoviricetes sp.]
MFGRLSVLYTYYYTQIGSLVNYFFKIFLFYFKFSILNKIFLFFCAE